MSFKKFIIEFTFFYPAMLIGIIMVGAFLSYNINAELAFGALLVFLMNRHLDRVNIFPSKKEIYKLAIIIALISSVYNQILIALVSKEQNTASLLLFNIFFKFIMCLFTLNILKAFLLNKKSISLDTDQNDTNKNITKKDNVIINNFIQFSLRNVLFGLGCFIIIISSFTTTSYLLNSNLTIFREICLQFSDNCNPELVLKIKSFTALFFCSFAISFLCSFFSKNKTSLIKKILIFYISSATIYSLILLAFYLAHTVEPKKNTEDVINIMWHIWIVAIIPINLAGLLSWFILNRGAKKISE